MADPSAAQALVTIGFGALAGGLTNAVAIWMLFHPYEPRGVGRFVIQGAIPKNRTRLARTVGRTVGQRLLAPDDLTRQLAAPTVREAFEGAVGGFLHAALQAERGSLRTELPAGVLSEVEHAFRGIAPTLAARFAEFAATDEFQAILGDLLARATRELDRPLGDVLTAERRAALRDRVEQWVADAAESADLETTLQGWFGRQLAHMEADQTPLLERLPPQLVGAVEKGIASYLPVALDRLAALLANPDARRRIQRALHELFQRFARDLLLHERIVARLVVTERTIERLLGNFERDGVDHLTRLLDEPAMRTEVARSVNEAVVAFLRRPLAEHLANLGPERRERVAEAAAGYVARALRDPLTRRYAIDRLEAAVAAAEHRTLGDLLRHLPADRAAPWLARGARTPQARTWLEEGIAGAFGALLDRPIGRPAAWLPDGATERLTAQLTPALWDWIQRQVPIAVAQLDVETMVEQKVLGFSMERLEQIVRQTTQRELDLIVRLGYLLGGMVGVVAWAAQFLVG
ncbi:MAG TPA: DUF445 family protein [Gemmatimonadales bacterium]